MIVFVDPWQRQIAELRDPSDYSLAERVIVSMHAIHDGSGFGWGVLAPAKRRLDRAARRPRLLPLGARPVNDGVAPLPPIPAEMKTNTVEIEVPGGFALHPEMQLTMVNELLRHC